MASKSETIRTLFQQGKTPSEIARELGLTYQRVYNTLRRAGLIQPRGERPSPGEYREFIAGLDILGVELLEAHARLEREPRGKKGLKADLEAFGPERTEEGFRAGLGLRLALLDDEGQFGLIHLRVAGRYHSSRFPDPPLFQVFRQQNLPLNLWPYLRLYVDFFTGQMGLPRLTLPALKR